MLINIQNAQNKVQAVHVTYLDKSTSQKANVAIQKNTSQHTVSVAGRHKTVHCTWSIDQQLTRQKRSDIVKWVTDSESAQMKILKFDVIIWKLLEYYETTHSNCFYIYFDWSPHTDADTKGGIVVVQLGQKINRRT